jgi:hypothetical protein
MTEEAILSNGTRKEATSFNGNEVEIHGNSVTQAPTIPIEKGIEPVDFVAAGR